MSAELARLREKVHNFPSPSSYNRLIELLLADGHDQEAEQCCRRSIRDFPRNPHGYMFLADLADRQGNLDEVQELLHKAVTQDPRSLPAHYKIADFYQRHGHLNHALQHYQIILKLQPEETLAQTRVAGLTGKEQEEVAESASAAFRRSTKRIKKSETSAAEQQINRESGAYTSSENRKHHESTVTFEAEPSGLTTVIRDRQRTLGAVPSTVPGGGTSRSGDQGQRLLDDLIQVEGMRSAQVIDHQGRTLMHSSTDDDGDVEVMAALSHDVARATSSTLATAGLGDLVCWSLEAAEGQACSYHQADDQLTLIALADRSIKIAMVELRAKQALQQLGNMS